MGITHTRGHIIPRGQVQNAEPPTPLCPYSGKVSLTSHKFYDFMILFGLRNKVMRTPSKKKAHLFIKTQYENNRNMLTCLKINTNMKRLDRKTERSQPASQSKVGWSISKGTV